MLMLWVIILGLVVTFYAVFLSKKEEEEENK